jgi:two-component system, NtrC family, nitrogen regulation sensor histidine kinase GlnL
MAVERFLPSPIAHYDPADLLDALATGIVVLDAQLCVIYANVAAQGLLAMSFNQARGRPFADLFLEMNGLIATLKRARDEGDVYSEREILMRPVTATRDPRVLDITVTPLEGQMTGTHLLLELSDETQRTRLTRESELRARLEGSRMMTRQLGHEIKNPLGGLRGAAQLLERELANPALREYTGVIISEADRLTALVDSMAGPARPLQKRRMNVHEICEHVYQLLRGEAKPSVLLERDYDPSLPEAPFDRNQLIQALLNLARNALQAVGDRGRIVVRTRIVGNARIGLERHRLAVRIDIEDNGPGVPDSIRGSLFYPLVTGRPNGTGLGLAVAQEIVTRHAGAIEFQSEPGHTIFSVMLPLEIDEASS